MIHLRTRLALTPCANATPATEAPRTWHASTTRALNSGLCLRLTRRVAAPLSVRSISMVSTFFMVDTIGLPRYAFNVGSPHAYPADHMAYIYLAARYKIVLRERN